MGCGTSKVPPAWEAIYTDSWPVYVLKRFDTARADLFRIRVYAPSGELVLTVQVQLWQTQRGHVSAKALHPANVEFSVGVPEPPSSSLEESVPTGQISLAYSPRMRTLAGLRKYVRTVAKSRDLGSWDTLWRADNILPGSAAALIGAALLPNEISVINVDERVCVYRGKVQAGVDTSSHSGDLLARVPTAKSDSDCFDIAVHPELDAAYARHVGVLPIFLAIAIEGFWSQGPICLGQQGGRMTQWQDKVDNRVGPPPMVREGKNVIRVMQQQNRQDMRRQGAALLHQ